MQENLWVVVYKHENNYKAEVFNEKPDQLHLMREFIEMFSQQIILATHFTQDNQETWYAPVKAISKEQLQKLIKGEVKG